MKILITGSKGQLGNELQDIIATRYTAKKEEINNNLATKIYKYVRMFGRCDINE